MRPVLVLDVVGLTQRQLGPDTPHLTALARRAEVELWATIPWFPGARLLRRWSAAGRLGEVPRQEQIDELSVRHPRVVYLPKLAAVNGALYAASLTLDALAQRGRVDVVLGSWAYPDGYAVVRLARRLGARAVIVDVTGYVP